MKNSPEVNNLMNQLSLMLGNKLYLREVKEILNKLELSPEEKRTLNLLTNDLRFHKASSDNKLRRSRLGVF